jgi:hypothetical protein
MRKGHVHVSLFFRIQTAEIGDRVASPIGGALLPKFHAQGSREMPHHILHPHYIFSSLNNKVIKSKRLAMETPVLR